MGHQQHRQVIAVHQLLHEFQEHALAVLVHAGYRLVQDEQIRQRIKRQRKQHTLHFAAAQRAEPPPEQAFTMGKRQLLADMRTRLFPDSQPDRTPGDQPCHQIFHGHGHLPVKGEILRHISGADRTDAVTLRVLVLDPARVAHLAQQSADQRGLARAVRTDERR